MKRLIVLAAPVLLVAGCYIIEPGVELGDEWFGGCTSGSECDLPITEYHVSGLVLEYVDGDSTRIARAAGSGVFSITGRGPASDPVRLAVADSSGSYSFTLRVQLLPGGRCPATSIFAWYWREGDRKSASAPVAPPRDCQAPVAGPTLIIP